MVEEKLFPQGMEPLGDKKFNFLCHPKVACYTVCCKNVDLDLYPYDLIRLKQSLNIDSETFIRSYTELKKGGNPYFPTVKLRLKKSGADLTCPFLKDYGCAVYQDRPTACRTYPLERAVDRDLSRGRPDDYYFLTRHSYCLGHEEDHCFSSKKWIRNQRLDEYNLLNDLWAEVDTLFAGNPWKGEGIGGSKQQLAFLVCYDIDGFRSFSQERNLLNQFRMERDWKRRVVKDDAELLKFGFEWLKYILGSTTMLVLK